MCASPILHMIYTLGTSHWWLSFSIYRPCIPLINILFTLDSCFYFGPTYYDCYFVFYTFFPIWFIICTVHES